MKYTFSTINYSDEIVEGVNIVLKRLNINVKFTLEDMDMQDYMAHTRRITGERTDNQLELFND